MRPLQLSIVSLLFSLITVQINAYPFHAPGNLTSQKLYVSQGEKKMVKGLKTALEKGAKESVEALNQKNGYYKDELVKIPFPPKAEKMADKLRDNGMGNTVDDLVKKLNRAAEDAAEKAQPIFLNAITDMSVKNAVEILKGRDTAATHYFRNKTQADLFKAFKPDIQASLKDVGAQSAWESVSSAYNKVAMFSDPVQTDLAAYTTNRALEGLFFKIKQEEQKIRKDPMARTSKVLEDVFGGG